MTSVLQRSLASPAPVAIRGEGLYLILEDGRRLVDATGGAAVACLGHGHPRVIEAMARQAERLCYAHTGFFSSEPAEELADVLVGHRPGGLSRALFVSSGSEAMEAAIKLARQYFLEIGEPERVHLIGRRQSYHGATLATLGVGGHRSRRAPYSPLFPPHASHVSPCFAFHFRRPDEDDRAYVARLAAELESEFERVGPGRVMAFCAETVVGAATGCVTAVPGYFEAIRAVCDRHGALLILDEIMSGMGRTGTAHAWETEGVTPDIQAVGKGLGGGYQAIGGLLISERVVTALTRGSGTFAHGQTYQAHPVACAAALAVQRVIAEDDLIANVRAMGELLEDGLRDRLESHPNVGDIRGRGLFLGVEFLEDRARKQPFSPELNLNDQLKRVALEEGLCVYPGAGTIDGTRGDHVLLAPPFTATPGEIELIVDLFTKSVSVCLERNRPGGGRSVG
jgi:adenosylmethionine-8-amino-7-oxononanoate aminotransferase